MTSTKYQAKSNNQKTMIRRLAGFEDLEIDSCVYFGVCDFLFGIRL